MTSLQSGGQVRMFSIGEFSKVTGLTVKTLRHYHEEGVLGPSFVDQQTGYRHYDRNQIETARAIAYLRSLDFPLNEIKELLRLQGDEKILATLERHRAVLQERIKNARNMVRSLDQFIREERETSAMTDTVYQVHEKNLEPVLIGGIRMKGRYSDCGAGFAKLGRSLGRYICGSAMLLHFDAEYHEDDADFECCMPIRQARKIDGISFRELPATPCVSLLHKGPYEQLGKSYAKVLMHVKERGYAIVMPTREVYVKGPGMIFEGNPRNYLTEIQISVETLGGKV